MDAPMLGSRFPTRQPFSSAISLGELAAITSGELRAISSGELTPDHITRAVTVGGCESDRLPEVVARGEVIDVAPLGGGPVCAGTVRMLDYAMGEVERRLGLPDQDRVTFYWGPDAADAHCPSNLLETPGTSVRACAPLGTREVIGPLLSFEHELVHVASRRVGRATPLIEEGLAIFVSGGCVTVTDPEPLTTYVGPDIEGDVASDAYAIGGSFVAFLIEQHGRPKLLDLKAATPADAEAATFEAAALDVYGERLEVLEEQWEAERVEVLCGPEIPRWPEIPSFYDYERATFRSTLACDTASTYGPIDPTVVYGDGLWRDPLIEGMYAHHAIIIPQATRVSAIMDGPAGTKAQLVRQDCWDFQWDEESADPELRGVSVITVHAGETRELLLGGCTWNVYLVADDYDEVDVALVLEPMESV